jgi:hypothetical protein
MVLRRSAQAVVASVERRSMDWFVPRFAGLNGQAILSAVIAI